jgi:hypothetical protein
MTSRSAVEKLLTGFAVEKRFSLRWDDELERFAIKDAPLQRRRACKYRKVR